MAHIWHHITLHKMTRSLKLSWAGNVRNILVVISLLSDDLPHSDLHRKFHYHGSLVDKAHTPKNHQRQYCTPLPQSMDLKDNHLTEKSETHFYYLSYIDQSSLCMNNITQLNMNDKDKNLEYGKRNNGSHEYLLMGHFCLLHTSLSIESPIHFRPPYCGVGLLHSLSRLFKPPSHVAEQVAQGDHGPQPPSAVWTHRYTTQTWITLSF